MNTVKKFSWKMGRMLKRGCKEAVAAGLCFLIMTVAGCGSRGVHEPLNEKAKDQVVIRVAWWGEEERDGVTGKILELYSQMHPEVVFETQSFSWNNYYDGILQETAKGEMPDLIQMDYQYIRTYSENGSLADLACFVEDGTIRTQDIDEKILDSGMVDGELKGIVLGTTALSMVYNSDVFDEAGIPYPDGEWNWEEFMDICMQIKEKTGKYGLAMTPILDLNLYQYWVRQQGEELFLPDQRSLGYEEDSVYVGYVELFKELMDAEAAPNPDTWAAIDVRGTRESPVIIGEGGITLEWNNFLVRMDYNNSDLHLVTPPLAEGNEHPGLWMKPSMFFSVAQTSGVKRECAAFIDWFINSEEANALLKGERGVPISEKIRKSLLADEGLPAAQRGMFRFADEAVRRCGDAPPPEPAGIDGINEAFAKTATACFYDVTTAEEAAAEFRRRANEILAEYGK